MKKFALSWFTFLLMALALSAQEHKTIIVKAGTRVNDYFTQSEQYRYPEFTQGKICFRNGTITVTKLNYSFLAGEMQFLASGDTMAIANEKTILYIQIMLDTFYYDNGYLEALAGRHPLVMAVKQYVKLADTRKEGPMGTRSSASAAQSYGVLLDQGHLKNSNLVVQEDIVLSRNNDLYIGNAANGFLPYKKGNVLKMFPKRKKDIDNYLKSNAIDFRDRASLVKLTGYLLTL